MADERVVVEIDSEGEVEISVEAVRGPGCVALTRELEKHLGTARDRTLTRAYHSALSQERHEPQGR